MSSSIFSRLQGIFPKRATATLAAATFSSGSSSTPIQLPTTELLREFENHQPPLKKSNTNHFRPRLNRVQKVVGRLSTGTHFSANETILEYQKTYEGNIADEGFGVRLVRLYGKARLFDHAYKLFDELPHFGCPRTVNTCNALLRACVRSTGIDEIVEFFRDFPEKFGIQPDVVSYNMVIKAYIASNDLDSAMKMVEKMEESSVLPDIVHINTLLDAYYKENRLEEAEKFWQRMEEKGAIANVRTYNAKLRSMINNDQVHEAMELFNEMVNGVVKPDTYSYNAVIKGCVSSGKLEEAKILHSNMVGDDCLPDHMTYLRLIPFAYEKGDIDFALQLAKQALPLNLRVDSKLMQLVVDALIEKSMIEDANELVALLNSSTKHHYTIRSPVPE